MALVVHGDKLLSASSDDTDPAKTTLGRLRLLQSVEH
jgi:hypothetical protein